MRYSGNCCAQRIRRLVSGSATALVVFPSTLLAAAPGGVKPAAVSATQIINLLVALVVVLLVFFAIVFLLKRLSAVNGMNRGHMKIVDTLHLGTKERLLIVRVTGKHLLLGISPQGIHPLHVLNDNYVEDIDQAAEKPGSTFTQLLANMKFGGH